MRIIRFRAWEIDTKKMLSWEELDKLDKEGILHLFDVLSEPHNYGVIPLQFTGIKDKNGKEIYQGDIVKICGADCPEDAEDEKHIMVVKWDKQGGYISEYNCGFEFDPLIGNEDLEMEIIGNIYENPDLLK